MQRKHQAYNNVNKEIKPEDTNVEYYNRIKTKTNPLQMRQAIY